MGSSCPAFWDEQSSRRKEISRLFGTNCKTIALICVGLFCCLRVSHETPRHNFPGEYLTIAVWLLVFPRQKADKRLELTGKALAERKAVVVPQPTVHKGFEQDHSK
jgi:hypothetical protein